MTFPTPQCPLEHYCPLNSSKKSAIVENFQQQQQKFIEIIKDLTVLNGPFKGMKYPSLNAYGSVICPKILGSYEKELNSLIETLCQKPYTSIVDIGCAEGYYAVGLALRIPEARVYAFDSSEQAQALCEEMAQTNAVSIECCGSFRKETFKEIDLSSKTLIICDCEGYEANIFDSEIAQELSHCDLLIESHDCINIEITEYLYTVFSKTHSITEIESIDDTLKAYRYNYPELTSFSLKEKKEFLSEHRGHIMRWLYMEPKTSQNH